MDKLIRDHRWLCTLACLAFSGLITWWLISHGTDVGDVTMKACVIGAATGLGAAVECWRLGGQLQRQAKSPDAPWLWRPDWARGEVVFSTFSNVAMRWGLVLVVSVVGYGLALLTASTVGKEFFTHWSFWALNAFVLGFVFFACKDTRRWLRQGRKSTFRLGTIPGRVGGKLTGTVNLARRTDASKGFGAVLSCVMLEGDEAHETLMHALVPVEPLPVIPQNAGRNRLDLPLTFQIPADAPPTQDDWPTVQWIVTVKARADGDDFDVQFEVPVFA